MANCTQVLPPVSSQGSTASSDSGAALGSSLADFVGRIRQNGIRKKIGQMLAKGECVEAANYALEKGRLELGLALRDYCAGQANARMSLTAAQMAQHMAAKAETGVEVYPGLMVTQVNSLGDILEIKLTPAHPQMSIGEEEKRWAQNEVCGQDWQPFLEKGGLVMISIVDASGGLLASKAGDWKLCKLGDR